MQRQTMVRKDDSCMTVQPNPSPKETHCKTSIYKFLENWGMTSGQFHNRYNFGIFFPIFFPMHLFTYIQVLSYKSHFLDIAMSFFFLHCTKSIFLSSTHSSHPGWLLDEAQFEAVEEVQHDSQLERRLKSPCLSSCKATSKYNIKGSLFHRFMVQIK
jgi:hypothetical protein